MTDWPQNWSRPTHVGYDDVSRVFSNVHQARPAVVASVADVAEVQRALAYARSEGLSVAVRGGGHSLSGFSSIENGLVIDLRKMSGVEPAAEPGQFWVGGGTLAGDVASRLGGQSLVLPPGDSPAVGIGGITLGGGTGWLTRKFGLTLDSLMAAEVTLADGSMSIAHASHDPDLFWALRGGGGNFGVVTRLRFRPHPLAQVLGGTMRLPLTGKTLRLVIETIDAAPEELGAIILAMRAPDDAAREPILMLTLVWSGDIAAGERVFAQLRTIATPIAEDISVMPYEGMYKFAIGEPPTVTIATENMFADVLDDAGLATVVEAANTPSVEGVLSIVEIRVLGGAMAHVPVSATAFAHRERKLSVSVVRIGFPLDRYEEHRAWVNDTAQPLRRLRKGMYLNFVEHPDATASAMVYPESTARRLAEIKQAVDRHNLFARNLPLPPAGG